MTKRIKPHILEKAISALMVLFGVVAIWIFALNYNNTGEGINLAIIMILMIVVLAILAQTVILIRIYELVE